MGENDPESNEPELDEPAMYLTFCGEEYEVTRDDAALFMYMGKLALYNHIFIALEVDEDDEDAPAEAYIFSMNEQYEAVRDFMMDNDYPMHANLRYVADCDLDAYDEMIKRAVKDIDTVPEEWLQ